MFVNVDNIEFQPSFRRSPEKSMQDEFRLSRNEFEIIERVLSLASDKFYLQQGIHKTLEMIDPLQKLRFFKWLEFLLDNSFLRSKLFNEFLSTVIWAVRKKLFLFRQTQYQFDSCKYYLNIIFKTDVNFMHLQKCREAFLCICILAERPDLQITSFTKALPLLENVFEPKGVQFFDHLFNDNTRPLFFKEHLIDCSFDEIILLIALLEGGSPRKLLDPIYRISKRENALLHNLQLNLTAFHTEVIDRYILAARLLKEAPHAVFTIQSLLETSHKFEEDPVGFAKDIDFWKDVVRLISTPEESLTYHSNIRALIDYLEYQRYGGNEILDYTLKGRTLNSLIRVVDEWHFEAAFDHTEEDLEATWISLGIPDYKKTNPKNILRITEITSGKRLLKESEEMKHCVFSYLGMCRTGKTHIFSLTEETLSIGETIEKPLVTIEVKERRLVQAYGEGNCFPASDLVVLISDWCDKNGIEK
ncbi:PcfJ domain-containing protein [Gillisia sp. Q332]|uniref:PcfJ domain-containing protein n=1 Tax=Gillisia xinjiangensis TaxID=3384765 RepID=UPI00391C3E74